MRRQIDQTHHMLEQHLDAMERAGAYTLWHYIRAFLYDVLADPIIAPKLDAAWGSDIRDPIRNTDGIPKDPQEWGRRAFAGLRFHYEDGNDSGTVLDHIVHDRNRGVSDHVKVIEMYVRPAVRWLRALLESGADVDATLERWCRRIEWFPPDLKPLNEDALQRDLHLFLFDAGVHPTEAVREAWSARGRIDFLLVREPPMLIEMKVWRGGTVAYLAHGQTQAAQYARDFDVRVGYLLIAVAPGAARRRPKRLQLAPALREHSVLVDGIDFHVRVVDLNRPKTSAERREIVHLTADALTARSGGV